MSAPDKQPPVRVTPTLMYRIMFVLLRAVLSPYYQRKQFGQEHVPTSGALIMAGNHTQNSDPFMIAFVLPVSRPAAFMAKIEMFVNPIAGWFFRSVHQFPVNRGAADRNAIRHALGILSQGGVLGIFPQGTRSASGEVTDAQAGVAFMALQSGAPVLPVGIARERVRGLIRHQRVTVYYGEPIDPTLVAELPKKERVGALTSLIVTGINQALTTAEKIGAER